MQADSGIANDSMLICPSVSSIWSPEQVWNTGFLEEYGDYLSAVAVEQ